jgi:hypothetical protein
MVHTMEVWGKRAVVALLTISVVRAVTARAPANGERITPELAHRAYHDITSSERKMRREAALAFPGDPWSQDDDFHSMVQDEVRKFATLYHTSIADVLRALDDGMKEGWPAEVRPNPRVPPCRPRMSY